VIRRALTLAAATLLLVACGSGDDGDGRFDAAVDEVRAAVQAGDRDAAFAHLDTVGLLAMEAHAEGELGEDEAAELSGLLDQARLLVAAEVPEPTTTTEAPPPEPPTTEPASAPAPFVDDDDDDDDDKKKNKDNKKDKDDDD
jgi:hypothetical protein